MLLISIDSELAQSAIWPDIYKYIKLIYITYAVLVS